MAKETQLVRIPQWLYDEIKMRAIEERRPIGSQLETIYVEWEQLKKLLAKLEVERDVTS